MRDYSKKSNASGPVLIDNSHAVFYQPSVIDPLLFREVVSSDGTKEVEFVNDIYLLFDQKRLNSIGSEAVQTFLNSLNTNSNSQIQDIRKTFSDDQLISFIKSRHIQSPSELQTWLNYLQDMAKDLVVPNSDSSSGDTTPPPLPDVSSEGSTDVSPSNKE